MTTHHLARRRTVGRLASLVALAGALVLQGCTTPLDARKDAQFQSYATQSDRPVVRPTRSISSFSDSLMCMDHMLREAQLPPTLITSIETDLAAGHAAVIQIVSTGEALMERRLSEVPTEEWNDIRVDITPREYVLSGTPDKT